MTQVDSVKLIKNNMSNTSKIKNALKTYKKQKFLLLALLPGIIYYIVFHYAPMYGVVIAFKRFNFSQGILGSPWIGLENFRMFLGSPDFLTVLKNTLIISFMQLIFGFPAPLILAVMLNEVANERYKKVVQTISYLPHFLSWIVLSGIVFELLSPSRGVVNYIIMKLGGQPINFMTSNKWFRLVLLFTNIWKEVGWNSIVYLAAVTNIDSQLYEAAIMDGANRLKQIRHITLPSLVPIVTIMLIFAVGKIINDNFDQIYNLYRPAVYPTADVISTYVYRMGIEKMEYSLASAVGLFKNIISLILIVGTNMFARRVGEYGDIV